MERPILDLRGERFASMTQEQKAKAVYGGKFRLVGNLSEWTRQNPQEAQAVRAVAADLGLVGPSKEQRVQSIKDTIVPPRKTVEHTPQLERDQAEFPEDKCREMFAGDGAAKLAAVDPPAYQRLRHAAAGFDIIALDSSYHVTERARGHATPTAKPEPEPTPEERAGLERVSGGLTGTPKQWASLLVANAKK